MPYIESPGPHLANHFLKLVGSGRLRDIAELYWEDKHAYYTGLRGVMSYYQSRAIERVSGFGPIYGRGMYEDSDLALNINRF